MAVESTAGLIIVFHRFFCGLWTDFVEINILFQQYLMNSCGIP